MRISILAVLNVLALILVLFFNYYSNTGNINGTTVGEVSARNPTLFTPAGLTFAIWGLIYLGLIVFVGYQAQVLFREHPLASELVRRISIWFALSSLANVLWLLAWLHQRIGLSMLCMLLLLLSLVVLYSQLHEAGARISAWTRLPFSLYLGWICVATVANASIYLSSIGWEGWGWPAASWTVIMLVVVGLLGLFFGGMLRDVTVNLVFLWALLGIFLRQQSSQGPEAGTVITGVWVAAFLVVLGLIIGIWRSQQLAGPS